MSLEGDVIAVGIAGAVLLAAGWYATKKAAQAGNAAKETLVKALPMVDPTSDQNLAYRGVNAVGAALTGKSDFRLGVELQSWFETAPQDFYQIPKDFGVKPEDALGW